MIEQWKDIPDYEGLYQVSNNGDVKSLSREMKNRFNSFVSKEKVLKKGLSSSGVSYVKRKKIWKAQIRINTKVVTIGYFKSEQDAKIAYENKLKTIQ